ncbi:hypothetical protein CHARACLAT_028458 [Characodon lateralis]|uniref:Uncharacterized protein n=1 Tax=Characodon lateralis TaxID=208331 RepID=A0ABU7F6T5_9TELE|nr:hypothetical protein [Characodon lateralis]
MQQDCQLGIPPPSSHLAILILSLPLCRLSFYLSSSLPLPPIPLYPGVTDYHSADGCRGECRDDTQYLKAGTSTHTTSPPPSLRSVLCGCSRLINPAHTPHKH